MGETRERRSSSGTAGGTGGATGGAGLGSGVARAAGWALGAGFAALAAVRRPHPIHPHGVVLHGSLTRTGSGLATGVPWLDEPADAVPVLARASRSAGVAAPLPDVIGLAVRLDGGGKPADLELASTGVGWPWRFALVPHVSPSRALLGSLLPYRTPTGPVLLAARTVAPDDLPAEPDALARRLERQPWRLALLAARPRGEWHRVGELALRRAPGPRDALLRFDAGRHPLPGTEQYAWVRRLRDPAYRRVQGDIDAG